MLDRRKHPRRRASDFAWTPEQRAAHNAQAEAMRGGRLLPYPPAPPLAGMLRDFDSYHARDVLGDQGAREAEAALRESPGIPPLPRRSRLWRVLQWETATDKWFALALLLVALCATLAILIESHKPQ